MLSKVGAALFAVVPVVAFAAADAAADDTSDCIAASEAAQSLRDARSFLEARQQLAVCSRDVCPRPVRSDCLDLRAQIDAAMPSVVFRAKVARGDDAADVTVLCDGAAMASQMDGHAQPVNPGAHTFRFERPGSPPVERKVVIGEGEKDRLVVVELPSADAAPAPGGTSAPAPSSPSDKPREPRDGRLFLPGLVVGAAGLAASIPMLAFWIAGSNDLHQMRDTCAPSAGGAGCPSERVDSDRTKLVVGDVFLGLSVAGVATGAVLLLTHRGDQPTPEASGIQLRPIIAPTWGGAMAGAGGRF